MQFRNDPWCDGIVHSLTPLPGLPPAKTLWNEDIRNRFYGFGSEDRLDGDYLDSLEGYAVAEVDFEREHLRRARVPLTFSTATRRPALLTGLAIFEFVRWMCENMRRMDRLLFANAVPERFSP